VLEPDRTYKYTAVHHTVTYTDKLELSVYLDGTSAKLQVLESKNRKIFIPKWIKKVVTGGHRTVGNFSVCAVLLGYQVSYIMKLVIRETL
jgi:hypothetical protein